MKKFLLFISSLPMYAFGQVLMNENFDSYTVGQVNTDVSGNSAASNGYYVFSGTGTGSTTTNSGAETAQFVNEGSGKALQLITPNGNVAANGIWKGGFSDLWNGRTAGNNILHIQYKFKQNTANNSSGTYGVYLYEANGEALVGARTSSNDLQARLICYYNDNGTVGTFYFNSPAGAELMYATNQWSTVDLYFNYDDGQVAIDLDNTGLLSIGGAGANVNPSEVDILSYGANGNTTSETVIFDDLVVSVSNFPLSVEDVTSLKPGISVIAENPVKDQLVIKLAEIFDVAKTTISISDMNGKQVASMPYADAMNVAHLDQGVYIVTISDGVNSENQKLIKQ